ncbi:MAG: MaoC family dehydratase [Chloroflexota bacterium]
MAEPAGGFHGRQRLLDQETIARYAAASGDHNPIHVDRDYAAGTPFGGTIAHGMLLLAYVGEMMEEQFGAAWLAGSALKVRFRAPARPGDRVMARGQVERREVGGDGQPRAVCSVRVVNDRDEVLISGEARVLLSD